MGYAFKCKKLSSSSVMFTLATFSQMRWAQALAHLWPDHTAIDSAYEFSRNWPNPYARLLYVLPVAGRCGMELAKELVPT
jgi:hypothetical protein